MALRTPTEQIEINYSEIIKNAIEKIQNDLEQSVGKFQNLLEDDSAASTYSDLKSLYDLMTQFQAKIQNISQFSNQIKENSKNYPEKIERFHRNFDALAADYTSLLASLDSFKKYITEFDKDASETELVEIVGVSAKSHDLWSVKVRSAPNSTGNFRNISICRVEDNAEICKIKLIEPGVEVKVFTNVRLQANDTLVAKVEEKFVSYAYRV